MASVGDFLRRFRTHGVPGAPAPTAVPIDRQRALAAELAPVFAALEAAQLRAAALRRAGAEEAAKIRVRAAERVGELASAARQRANQARQQEAAAMARQVGADTDALLDRARHEAAGVDEAVAHVAPAFAQRVVSEVLGSYEQPRLS